MKLREQLSNSELAKRTGLSRNTVKKWLKAPGDQAPKYKRQSGFTKLSAFEATLVQALKADSNRPKHARRSARALLAQLQAQDYRGGYSRWTDFTRGWREQEGKAVSKAYVPLSFEPGEAFQFDWSEEGLLIGGVYHHMQVSHLKLCASRAFWIVPYPSQGHEMLFDAHTCSFAVLGGVARRGIYDNMKTAVDKVKKGKGRIVNARVNALCSHYLFEPDFCNVASGWEKGVMEKNVQDSRRRIWIEAGTKRFGSFVKHNAWLAERCRSIWAETAHPEHRQLTPAEMLDWEREHLMSMPGAQVLVLLGECSADGLKARSPIQSHQDMNYFVVMLKAGAQWRFSPPAQHDVAWAFGFDGQSLIQNEESEQALVTMSATGDILLSAPEGPARVLVGTARQLDYPLVLGSSSVHTSGQALAQGLQRIRSIGNELMQEGRLGRSRL